MNSKKINNAVSVTFEIAQDAKRVIWEMAEQADRRPSALLREAVDLYLVDRVRRTPKRVTRKVDK